MKKFTFTLDKETIEMLNKLSKNGIPKSFLIRKGIRELFLKEFEPELEKVLEEIKCENKVNIGTKFIKNNTFDI